MMGSFLTRGLVMALGYAYPAYECFKTVEMNKPEIEQLRFWCQYWILVAVLTVFERIGDTFISWLPMYSEAKLAFFVYLWYPKTRGTTYVYESFLRPYVARHETEIDRNLMELRTRAGDLAVLYWQKAATYGQTRVFDVLQYVASQSSSRHQPPQQQQQAGVRRPPPPAPSTRPGAAPSSCPPSSQQSQQPTSRVPLTSAATTKQQEPSSLHHVFHRMSLALGRESVMVSIEGVDVLFGAQVGDGNFLYSPCNSDDPAFGSILVSSMETGARKRVRIVLLLGGGFVVRIPIVAAGNGSPHCPPHNFSYLNVPRFHSSFFSLFCPGIFVAMDETWFAHPF